MTFDFTNYNYGTYDLQYHTHVNESIVTISIESLDIHLSDISNQIKVITKNQLLVENDRLIDYQITDGTY